MTEEARKSTENAEDKRASIGGKGKVKYSENILPLARIKKIMKMDPNVNGSDGINGINPEANYLVCTATEMFIKWMSKEAYDLDTKALSYTSLSKFVQDNDKLDFLHQIIPHKITVKQYKKKLAEAIEKEKNVESGSDVSSEEEEEEEEEEEAEEEEEGDDENSIPVISSDDEKDNSKV